MVPCLVTPAVMREFFRLKGGNNMLNIKENESLSILNHSCAHLLAQAVKHLYPNATFWVGPVIEDGFYYDIDLGNITFAKNRKRNEEDFKRWQKNN